MIRFRNRATHFTPKAVGLGRPALYAMAAYGEDGIAKMLQLLKLEFQVHGNGHDNLVWQLLKHGSIALRVGLCGVLCCAALFCVVLGALLCGAALRCFLACVRVHTVCVHAVCV